MNAALEIPETDHELVRLVEAHDPDLARKVRRRFQSLRLQCITALARPEEAAPRRHASLWHSLRWPFGPRGQI